MDFHIGQFGYIKPVIDELIDQGINPASLLKRSGLDRFQLDDNDLYVPVSSIYRFFNALDEQEGQVDILENFYHRIQVESISEVGETVATSADVLTACRLGAKYNSAFLSNEQAGFDVTGNKAMFWHRAIDKHDHVGGNAQLTLLGFSYVLSGLRIATGIDWAPLEIHLQSKSAPNLDAVLPPGANTKIFLEQPATAIVFPTTMLTLPMLQQDIVDGITSESISDTSTVSSRIEHILNGYNQETLPNIKTFADITDMSSRTLQRRLHNEDSSYFEVIDQWRFKKALKLLANPGLKVKDVSEHLFYANVPNFERAFRRWTNTTPNRYRDTA